MAIGITYLGSVVGQLKQYTKFSKVNNSWFILMKMKISVSDMDRQLCVQTSLQSNSFDIVHLLCSGLSWTVLWRSYRLHGGWDSQWSDGHLLLDPLHLQHPQTPGQWYLCSSWCWTWVHCCWAGVWGGESGTQVLSVGLLHTFLPGLLFVVVKTSK